MQNQTKYIIIGIVILFIVLIAVNIFNKDRENTQAFSDNISSSVNSSNLPDSGEYQVPQGDISDADISLFVKQFLKLYCERVNTDDLSYTQLMTEKAKSNYLNNIEPGITNPDSENNSITTKVTSNLNTETTYLQNTNTEHIHSLSIVSVSIGVEITNQNPINTTATHLIQLNLIRWNDGWRVDDILSDVLLNNVTLDMDGVLK